MANLEHLSAQIFAALALMACDGSSKGRHLDIPSGGGRHLDIPSGARSLSDLPRGMLVSHGHRVGGCILGTWCVALGSRALAARAGSGPGMDARGCPSAIPSVPSPFGGPDIEALRGPLLPFQPADRYDTSNPTPPRHLHMLVPQDELAECCYRWAHDCGASLGVEGRAYVDDTGVRVASLHAGAPITCMPAIAALDSVHRHAFAHHWTEVGLAEHASIAAFARATLELMALGAPLDLIADMQRAAQDEVIHTRDAFVLASEYLGRELRPAALEPLHPRATDRVRAAIDTYCEACIGETCGAARAARAAEGCIVPEIAAVLARVATDEARHAALAWATLGWLVATDGDDVRAALRTRVTEIPVPRHEPPILSPSVLADHGVLPFADAVALDRETHRTIIEPALARLGV